MADSDSTPATTPAASRTTPLSLPDLIVETWATIERLKKEPMTKEEERPARICKMHKMMLRVFVRVGKELRENKRNLRELERLETRLFGRPTHFSRTARAHQKVMEKNNEARLKLYRWKQMHGY